MEAGAITRTERWLFVALAGAVGAYVIARAWCVPTIHDEAMTFFVYVQTGDFLPFLSHWDAGNHLLDTALAFLSYKLFGLHAWALRLPSVAAFVPYAWSAFRWGGMVRSGMVRWCLWSALLLFPFLLDFFALFRGYGIGMAGLSAALVCAAAYLQGRRSIHLIGALVWMLVATYADLGLITLHALLLCALLPATIADGRQRGQGMQLLFFLLLGFLPFAFAARYSIALEEHGSLYYGTTAGPVEGTIHSLTAAVLGLAHPMLDLLLAGSMLVLFTLAGWSLWSGGRDRRTWGIALIAGLLAADVLGRVVLFHWRGTLYPEDRTALQWALMAVLLFALILDDRAKGRRGSIACLLLCLPLRTLLTLNVDRTTYWPEQAIPVAVHQRIHDLQAEAGRPLTLGMYHQQPACWAFGEQEQGRVPILAQVSDHPHQGTELLLLDPREQRIPAGYHVVMDLHNDRQVLLAADTTPLMASLVDTVTSSAPTDAEFIELWKPGLAPLIGKDLRLDLTLTLTSDADPLLASLVCEMDLGNGERHYELVPLQFAQGRWNGDTLRTTRCVPRPSPRTERLVAYLWNKERRSIAHTTRITAHATSPGSFAPSPDALPGNEP